MARSDKIRKVNDDLYEQDFQADSGERSIFKWERQYEALHITLSNLQCIYGASVEIKEISLFGEGNDAINEFGSSDPFKSWGYNDFLTERN